MEASIAHSETAIVPKMSANGVSQIVIRSVSTEPPWTRILPLTTAVTIVPNKTGWSCSDY